MKIKDLTTNTIHEYGMSGRLYGTTGKAIKRIGGKERWIRRMIAEQ